MSSQPSNNSQEGLRDTPVVTNFLMRTDNKDPRILTVRRSQRVGSYNARWGGISGFVEKGVTPEEQAYTEIREETGLQADQVRMLRRGAVVEYVDPSIGRHWYVHPFLFEVLTPDAVHTDWEADEMRWIAPSDLEHYETVPKLKEAYESAANGEKVSQ
jgi:8-oxo-dGTP diphosphatase